MNIQDLFELAKKENKSLVFRPEKKLILLIDDTLDETQIDLIKDVIVYRIKRKQTVEKLNMKKLIEESTKVIAKHVSPEDMLRNLLRDLSPSEISEVYDRAVIRKGKIRTKNGCFEILIGGKKGRPFRLGIMRGD